MISEIWQHTNGDKYAVAVDSYGQIVGALGPLGDADPPHVLAGDWYSNQTNTIYVRANRSSFRDVTRQHDHDRARDARLFRDAE